MKRGFSLLNFLKKKDKTKYYSWFCASQIIPFGKINVDYFSLILGKTEDWGFSNEETIKTTKKILINIKSKTKLLLASIRNEDHLTKSIINGADVLTVPPTTWEKVFNNKYSNLALDTMHSDWKTILKKIKKNMRGEKKITHRKKLEIRKKIVPVCFNKKYSKFYKNNNYSKINTNGSIYRYKHILVICKNCNLVYSNPWLGHTKYKKTLFKFCDWLCL